MLMVILQTFVAKFQCLKVCFYCCQRHKTHTCIQEMIPRILAAAAARAEKNAQQSSSSSSSTATTTANDESSTTTSPSKPHSPTRDHDGKSSDVKADDDRSRTASPAPTTPAATTSSSVATTTTTTAAAAAGGGGGGTDEDDDDDDAGTGEPDAYIAVIGRLVTGVSFGESSVKDARVLVKTLAVGLSQLVNGIGQCDKLPVLATPPIASTTATDTAAAAAAGAMAIDDKANVNTGGATDDDDEQRLHVAAQQQQLVELLGELLDSGLGCFVLFGDRTQEQKDILGDHFAAAFCGVPPPVFRRFFAPRVGQLFDACLANDTVLAVAQALLTNAATSPVVCELLLQFLVARIDDVALTDERHKLRSAVVQKLFKLCFSSAALHAGNEALLQV
jgi:hypothetical protein